MTTYCYYWLTSFISSIRLCAEIFLAPGSLSGRILPSLMLMLIIAYIVLNLSSCSTISDVTDLQQNNLFILSKNDNSLCIDDCWICDNIEGNE